MPKNNEKLLVSWKGPTSKKNYFVGLLSKDRTNNGLKYKFNYNQEVVMQAKEEGFMPFVGLKDLNKEYCSDKLFPIFERRLPNRSRNIFKKFIEENELQNSDSVTWEYLKITKGRTATDNLSFLEPVFVEGGTLSYFGEIAGWSHTKNNNGNLKVQDQVILRHDEDNPEDHEAVEVIQPGRETVRVGYIQKPFNKVFFNLLAKGYSMSGAIDSIDSYDGRPTIFVQGKIPMEDIDNPELDHVVHIKS
ncbi:HIRAN domain-containing protein [Halobacillus locisalis]|uniref:HIRAN domain-containing protein n=1 Tax=Halobacillus locisalis TaxID=220753 RepID=A0A838CSB7_9BACI|nr:HIRAN domain-containing protein [Halobacillus locisalis]MBA2174834.1 HIRAN domain-containing protein [Halobacillus locisalis]